MLLLLDAGGHDNARHHLFNARRRPPGRRRAGKV